MAALGAGPAVNRLQLCQRLAQEADISGATSGPASTENQTGEYANVVNWIDQAYTDLQNRHRNWNFLRDDFSFGTVAAQPTYTSTDVALTSFRSWKHDTLKIYRTSAGQSTEQDLVYSPWDVFRYTRQFGGSASQSGQPTEFSIRPDKSLIFWPIPDAIYTVTGEYFRGNYDLSTGATPDTNTPAFPDDFHLILVWMGLMSYGEFEGDSTFYNRGLRNFAERYSALKADQLPPIGTAGPLV